MRLSSLLVACLMFWCSACATPQLVAPAAPAPGSTPAANGLAYLALGDSYTIGEGADAADRWPMQLAGLLSQPGAVVAAPTLIARTGWTTAELQAAIADARNQQTYGLVSLLIGVNNQYRGQSAAQYRTEFRALLQTAVAFAGGRPERVFVLSIPDWGQSPYGQRQSRDPATIAAEIDQFNAVAQDECRQARIAYVDITPETRAAVGDASQFTRDGLHYAGSQMRRWAEKALPMVQAVLK